MPDATTRGPWDDVPRKHRTRAVHVWDGPHSARHEPDFCESYSSTLVWVDAHLPGNIARRKARSIAVESVMLPDSQYIDTSAVFAPEYHGMHPHGFVLESNAQLPEGMEFFSDEYC